MDVDSSSPAAAPGSPRTPKDAASRVPASPDQAATQRSPRALLDGKRPKTRKPLVPATARPSQDDILANHRRNKGSLDDDKWDITPDGGSAGREGRQFAVANVGNNGRIYLRPTVRPAHQRYPQPNFVFPMTPPNTAGLEANAPEHRLGVDARPSLGHLPPSYPPSTAPSLAQDAPGQKQIRIRHHRHRRAMSDSTIPDTSIARKSERGSFKVVITQPGEDQRPRTVEMDGDRPPVLEVAIPTWRIGTPRFSIRGTPFIRGSSYAPTEDIRSSTASFFRPSPLGGSSRTSKRPSYFRTSGMLSVFLRPDPESDASQYPAPEPPPPRATYVSTHLVIEPSMFDALTFKPACDDRTIVRYSPSGAVTAATPPRLVAEITSPSFVDYELLSDFFLTYRSFLEPSDLLRMLFARLRWALSRTDEVGQVVRVRTFVALRHWILNYFLDDFLAGYHLRTSFCRLLNELVDEFLQDPKAPKVPLKILAELKKCWRRVCAQFWDGADFDTSLGPDAPVSPGGIPGNRDSTLDPTFLAASDSPRMDDLALSISREHRASFYAGIAKTATIDAIVAGDRPSTPVKAEDDSEIPDRNGAISPTSITSVDAVSCSFPTKSAKPVRPGPNHAVAHPVAVTAAPSSGPVATTPRALVAKRARAHTTASHRRNGSLSDSLRDHPSITERAVYKNAEFPLTLPYAGSLVRGDFLPPSHALAEVQPQIANGRQTTIFQPAQLPKENSLASAMSSQGMKKLLGSVRRALSTKGQHLASNSQSGFINLSSLGPRGATTNRLPGTAIVPQAHSYQNRGRPPVRIDLLGAEVAEDFRKAVREDSSRAQSEKSEPLSPPPVDSLAPGAGGFASHGNFLGLPDHGITRPTSDMGITTGSKSIVIMDDTSIQDDCPVMAGALPAVNSSVVAFAEALAPNGADPTPPTTPPGRPVDVPRRSSYILGQHVLRRVSSAEPLPPFVPDLDTLGRYTDLSEVERPRSAEDGVSREPSLAFSAVGGYRRQTSIRSQFSIRSPGNERGASFADCSVRQPTVRSFDATTISDQSLDDSPVQVPQPLRILRRRPGGDLRAVEHVGELEPSAHRSRGLRGSRSLASLTTYSESLHSSFIRSPIDSSGYVDVVASDCSPGAAETFSLGALASGTAKQKLSLFSTHSSKPIMRPSFEAEAQKLAQIPDDLDDDGGVEAALLKLEGKYPPKKKPAPTLSMDLRAQPPELNGGFRSSFGGVAEHVVSEEEKKEHRHLELVDEPLAPSPSTAPSTIVPQAEVPDAAVPQPNNRSIGQSFLSDDSVASYSSIPLLQRHLTDDGRSRREVISQWTDRSVLKGPEDDPSTPDGGDMHDSQHPSYEFIKKTESLEQMQQQQQQPAPEPLRDSASVGHSFLNVESDNDSDLSSELSEDELEERQGDDIFPPPEIGVAISTLPAHPLAESPPQLTRQASSPTSPTVPTSPKLTLMQALHMSPETAYVPTLHEHQVWEKPLPPTPDTAPASAEALAVHPPLASPADPTGTREALRGAPSTNIPDPVGGGDHRSAAAAAADNKYAVHLPFILGFDSDTLAQQFTLVEKDALNEIDWKELIDMRWKNSSATSEQGSISNVRSWVSFLRDTDARGVEVVIARFNIMVKWAISEVVLTRDIEERARCIIKFIHIAAHCRRYRNFATMCQITIALTSNEIARLAKTWELVPASDKRTLGQLEALMSPTRNFYCLRAEMEGGGGSGVNKGVEVGCIPFVGIYTHDLLFNAQKPSEIASSPTTPPLVNFERCRTAAAVVKTLLRLLEASTSLSSFRELSPPQFVVVTSAIIMNRLPTELWDVIITHLHNPFCHCTSPTTRPSTWDAPLPLRPWWGLPSLQPHRRCQYGSGWRCEAVFTPGPSRALLRELCALRLVNRRVSAAALRWFYSHGSFTLGMVKLRRAVTMMRMRRMMMLPTAIEAGISGGSDPNTTTTTTTVRLGLGMKDRFEACLDGANADGVAKFTGLRLDLRVEDLDVDEYKEMYGCERLEEEGRLGVPCERVHWLEKDEHIKAVEGVRESFLTRLRDFAREKRIVFPSVRAVEIRLDRSYFGFSGRLTCFIAHCLPPDLTDLVMEGDWHSIKCILQGLSHRQCRSLQRLVLSSPFDHSNPNPWGELRVSAGVPAWPSLRELSVRNFRYIDLLPHPEHRGLTRLHLASVTVPILGLLLTVTRGPSAADVPFEEMLWFPENVGGDGKGDSPLVALVLDNVRLDVYQTNQLYIFTTIRTSCPNLLELEVAEFLYTPRASPRSEDRVQRYRADGAALDELLATVRARPGGVARSEHEHCRESTQGQSLGWGDG
ncbi:hypothetical protein VTJ49DRAFT_5277 [Mycothermus thermophilus]|uniref:Guanine nucleotide exchange factor LTE1 n=1 Tax=Humicola insolens TaxID=85995 RepID=A0ABR3VKK5_HUMIN